MGLIIADIKGLGTSWSFEFFEDIESKKIEEYLTEKIKKFNDTYSRFLNTSVVSRLNKSKELKSPPAELIKMLEIGKDYYNVSEGFFNILTEHIQVARGYDKKYSFTPHNNTYQETNNYTFLESIDFNQHYVRLKNKTTVDLGGLGKGYLIDQIASELTSIFNLKYFVINGGGDIYVTSNYGHPVCFFLEHPEKNGYYVGKIYLKNQALCSSSPFKRRWRNDNKNYISHLINPNNKYYHNTTSSFVTSRAASDADILATIFTLIPHNKALHIKAKKECEFAQIKDQKLKRTYGFIMRILQ